MDLGQEVCIVGNRLFQLHRQSASAGGRNVHDDPGLPGALADELAECLHGTDELVRGSTAEPNVQDLADIRRFHRGRRGRGLGNDLPARLIRK